MSTKNMSTFMNTDFFLFHYINYDQRSEKSLERQFFENQIILKKFGDMRHVVSGGVPRAEEFLEMMPFGIFV